MSIVARSILVFGMAVAVLPAAVLANDRADARAAIIEARAKVATGDKAGVNGPAADVQARARAALAEAQDEYHHHHDGRALAAAERASSLADLARATADAREADAQRQLAIATPQE